MSGSYSASPKDGYRLIIAGSCGTGKTCLWKRFAGEAFPSDFVVSMSCDNTRTCTVEVDNTRVSLSIRDTDPDLLVDDSDTAVDGESGYDECDGCFLVYDVTDEATFDDLTSQWLSQSQERSSLKHKPKIMLLGNKCDLAERRAVDYFTARDFADRENLTLTEVSAKDGTNVDFALLSMILHIQQVNTVL